MKTITVLYRHSSHPIEIKLEDELADKLYADIFNARVAGKNTLHIRGENVSRFIDPLEIIDCMIFPTL